MTRVVRQLVPLSVKRALTALRVRLEKRLDTAFDRYPPRGYRLDQYKRWFPRTGEVFLHHLKRSGALPVPEPRDGSVAGVVIGPWVSTPTPWYEVMLAIGLARRGRKVVLIWDDTGFPEQRVGEQNRVLAHVLSYVGQFLPVVRLSEESGPPLNAADAAVIEGLTDQNLTWRLRGAPPTNDDQLQREEIRHSLNGSLPLVRRTLDRIELDCLVVPGGVYGTSGLFLHEAEARGCRVATVDQDRGLAQICVSGVAAQNADIPRAFEALWESGAEARRQAIETARAEFQNRVDSRDGYGFQALPAGRSDAVGEVGVLVPLNVEWDTAALGKHVHFANTVDWVTSSISAILERDGGPVTVRQHPSERRRLQRSQLDIASVLRDRFGDDRRCQFVAADDPVNTYDLLRSARLVLPFTSTIALEAAAIGKPVLISGASYYAGLGFVWSATSRDEYFALLTRGLRGDLEPLPDQADRAWLCYYLAAVRNRISTSFTPQPDDFWQWCRRAPDSLFAEPEVSDILEAIDCDVPVSLLRHGRLAPVVGRETGAARR